MKSNTPKNINNFSEKELLDYIKDYDNVRNKKIRLEVLKVLFKALRLDIENENLLMLLSEPQAKLCLATAGGGKTTAANVQAVLEKFIRYSRRYPDKLIQGDKILVLVYNRHNVNDFKTRHKNMVHRLKTSGIKNINIDDDIQVYTMHKFCSMWVREYADKMGLIGYKLLSDTDSSGSTVKLMQMSLKTAFMKNNIDVKTIDNYNINNLHTLYSYSKESFKTVYELEDDERVIDLKLPLEIICDTFSFYESMKNRKRVYDFTDMLSKIHELFSTNTEVLKDVQRYFEYVIADEVQDFSPLMFSILKLLVNNGTPLMAVGDEDQSIYNFRGADLFNTLDFANKFDDSEVFTLSKNRRCRKNILNIGKNIISRNTLRFEKELGYVKEGGDVSYVPYNTINGQCINIINKLNSYCKSELNETVIAAREKENLVLLTQILEENNIPHYVISGYHAFSHELYRHIIDVLLILYRPLDPFCQLNLYKVLPIKRDDLWAILKYDSKKERFSDDIDGRKHFAKIDYGNYLNNKLFVDSLKNLIYFSNLIKNNAMKDYINLLYQQISRFFWVTKKSYNNNPELDNIIEEKALQLFNSDCLFEEFYQTYLRRKDLCKRNQASKNGVAVSTFHSLKGLEFNNVYLTYLDNDIFPNFSLIDSKDYTEDSKKALKEAETRLFYVAITRAKNNIYFYYNEQNPSIYIKDLLNNHNKDNIESMNIFDEILEKSESENHYNNEVTSYIDIDYNFDIYDTDESECCDKAKDTVEKTTQIVEELSDIIENKESEEYMEELGDVLNSSNYLDSFLDSF